MDTKFQSKTFKFGFPEGEQFNAFKEDVEFLEKIETTKLERLIKYASKIVLAGTESEKRKISDEVIKKDLIISLEGIESFYRFVNFFLEVFSDEETKEDQPEDIVKDLAKKLEIEENELSSIKRLLLLIKNEAEQYKKEKQRELLKKGLFPYLKGFNTTVELRGVFNKEFRIGENLDWYIKDVKIEKNAIPIISVSISLDSGTPDNICFQVSRENLKSLIDELESALHKSKIFEESFNVR